MDIPSIVVTQAELDALPIVEDSSYDQKTLGRCKSKLCASGWLVVGHPSIEGGVAVIEVREDAPVDIDAIATQALLDSAKAEKVRPGTFIVGEKINIKGHTFKVAWMKKNRMLLKRITK